jgi:paraquat-inducible protein B
MGKPASKALIGAFVVGAVALAITAVLIFGSGRFLAGKRYVVMYFDGSVKGLSIGAPVMFRGVKIGSITDIELLFNPAGLTFTVPVTAEIDPDKVDMVSNQEGNDIDYIQALIAKGMKAQLQVQSFITGQLMVSLDFFPDKPARLVGSNKRYTEIPTTPSSFEEISKTIGELPIQELVSKLTSAVDGLNKLINSPEISASIRSANQSLQETGKILKTVNDQLEPIITNLQDTSANVKSVTAKFDQALSGEKGIPAQIEQTLAEARVAIKQAGDTLDAIKNVTSENSALMTDVDRTLEELTNSARSVRFLTEYLEQHPESLIRGKKAP